MSYLNAQGHHRLSCAGKPILYLENRNATFDDMERARETVRKVFDQILEKYGSASMIYWDFLQGLQISDLGQYFMEKGAFATPYITRLLDITESEDQLHKKLRKSFKSL